MMSIDYHEDDPVTVHVGCINCLLHSSCTLPHKEQKVRFIYNVLQKTNRTGGEDYCQLAVALAQDVHGKDTTLHIVYAELYPERSSFM
jgi:hypothetical protein